MVSRSHTTARQADAALDRTPGGERTAVNQVTWKDKGAVLTFAMPGTDSARGVGRSCSKGEVCLYDGRNFNGDWSKFGADNNKADFLKVC